MNFNSKKIYSKKLHSFLICNKYSIKYYKKFNWNIVPKNKFEIMNLKTKKILPLMAVSQSIFYFVFKI